MNFGSPRMTRNPSREPIVSYKTGEKPTSIETASASRFGAWTIRTKKPKRGARRPAPQRFAGLAEHPAPKGLTVNLVAERRRRARAPQVTAHQFARAGVPRRPAAMRVLPDALSCARGRRPGGERARAGQVLMAWRAAAFLAALALRLRWASASAAALARSPNFSKALSRSISCS